MHVQRQSVPQAELHLTHLPAVPRALSGHQRIHLLRWRLRVPAIDRWPTALRGVVRHIVTWYHSILLTCKHGLLFVGRFFMLFTFSQMATSVRDLSSCRLRLSPSDTSSSTTSEAPAAPPLALTPSSLEAVGIASPGSTRRRGDACQAVLVAVQPLQR